VERPHARHRRRWLLGKPCRQRPVNTGYVGSGSDAGHTGGDCEPGVNLDGTYNYQFINDFIRNGMKQQILLSKAVTNTYYAQEPAYNYWNGCSTGGRQGYVLAQELPKELDGILANAPAIYWTRFQTAQMFGQIAMRELTGGPIPAPKLIQATASAVAACDGADGVVDGVIDDPRTCSFSAQANVCGTRHGAGGELPDACRSAGESTRSGTARAMPKAPKSGSASTGCTNLSGLNGTNPFALGVTQFHWDEHDRTFDWKTVSIAEYPEVAQDGSRNIADVTDTFGDLKQFEKSGGKLLTLVGANDQLIMPRGVINYYRELATKGHKTDFEKQQEFYRLFRVPGAGHCQVPNAFSQLVNWVENGVRAGHDRQFDHGRRCYADASALRVPAKGDLQPYGRHQQCRQLPLRRRSRHDRDGLRGRAREVQARSGQQARLQRRRREEERVRRLT
jgi:hypothetical protein